MRIHPHTSAHPHILLHKSIKIKWQKPSRQCLLQFFDHPKLNNKTLIRGNIPTQLTLNSFSECVCAKKSVLFESAEVSVHSTVSEFFNEPFFVCFISTLNILPSLPFWISLASLDYILGLPEHSLHFLFLKAKKLLLSPSPGSCIASLS